jgi:ATP-dependent helicase HrpB
LSATVLGLHAWGKPNVREFGWYQAPAEAAVAAAERLLTLLGALDSESNGNITPLGQKLAAIPAHPRLARLLLRASEQGMTRDGATLAAILSEKDFVQDSRDRSGPAMAGMSDLIVRMMLLEKADDSPLVQQVRRIRDEFLRAGTKQTAPSRAGDRDETLLRLALEAYPDRVCKRRANDPSAGVMVGGGGVRLGNESAVRQGEFFLAVDARHDQRSVTREALVRIASLVRGEWLEEMFPQSIRRESGAEFDSQRKRVVGFNRVWYLDLLLREDRDSPVEAGLAGEILARELRPRAAELFAADQEAVQLMLRVGLLRQHLAEHSWPDFNREMLADVLAERCAGKRSLEEVLREPLAEALRAYLPYPLDRILEQQAPAMIDVPSGGRIALQYAENQPPVLAVRLQELFGWTQTPTLAGGRVRVRLHLLGPNYRPVQITDDLQNFWATTYFQVRKDLRARYPKHSWPENPLTAKAEAKGRRR